jgi:hexosaminidase
MLPIDFTANDVPRFAHRGIMIDSARHFLPVETILSVLDAMSYAKLNVLHWHLTDAESFPIFLPKEPSLSRGAFNPSSVYQPSDVALVVDVSCWWFPVLFEESF